MFCVVSCRTVVHSDMHTREQFLKMSVGLGLVSVSLCGFNILFVRFSVLAQTILFSCCLLLLC